MGGMSRVCMYEMHVYMYECKCIKQERIVLSFSEHTRAKACICMS